MRRNIWRTMTLSIAIAMALLISFARSFAQDAAVLPPPTDQPFKGKIGLTYKDSTPNFPAIKVPPKGAPNVFAILANTASITVGSLAREALARGLDRAKLAGEPMLRAPTAWTNIRNQIAGETWS